MRGGKVSKARVGSFRGAPESERYQARGEIELLERRKKKSREIKGRITVGLIVGNLGSKTPRTMLRSLYKRQTTGERVRGKRGSKSEKESWGILKWTLISKGITYEKMGLVLVQKNAQS